MARCGNAPNREPFPRLVEDHVLGLTVWKDLDVIVTDEYYQDRFAQDGKNTAGAFIPRLATIAEVQTHKSGR